MPNISSRIFEFLALWSDSQQRTFVEHADSLSRAEAAAVVADGLGAAMASWRKTRAKRKKKTRRAECIVSILLNEAKQTKERKREPLSLR